MILDALSQAVNAAVALNGVTPVLHVTDKPLSFIGDLKAFSAALVYELIAEWHVDKHGVAYSWKANIGYITHRRQT